MAELKMFRNDYIFFFMVNLPSTMTLTLRCAEPNGLSRCKLYVPASAFCALVIVSDAILYTVSSEMRRDSLRVRPSKVQRILGCGAAENGTSTAADCPARSTRASE